MSSIRFRIITLNLVMPLSLIIALWLAFSLNMSRVEELSSSTLDRSLRADFDILARQQVETVVSLLQGVNEQAKKGAYTLDEAKELAKTLVRELRYGDAGYFWIDDLQGNNVVLLGRDAEGKNRLNAQDKRGNSFVRDFLQHGKAGGGYTDYWFNKKEGGEALPKRSYTKLFEPFGWVVGTGNYVDDIETMVAEAESDIQNVIDKANAVFLAVALGGLLLAGVLAFWLGHRLASPIVTLAREAKGIARGELDVELSVDHKGEVGELAQSLKNMVEVLRQKAFWYESLLDSIANPISVTDMDMRWTFINRAAEQVAGVKRADILGQPCSNWGADICGTDRCGIACLRRGQQTSTFTQPGLNRDFQVDSFYLHNRKGEKVGHIEIVQDVTEANIMKKEAEKALERGMNEAASSIAGVVERITTAAEELSAQVEEIAQGADLQASRVGETATAMEEMNATVLEVARNAGSAASNAEKAKTEADNGSNIMNQVIKAIAKVESQTREVKQGMDLLGEQVESIGKVMNVINDIADQTNLLALNAAIEAARAGDAGRGFAVVADEVRKLAEKTMTATKEVGQSIQSIQSAARNSISEMDSSTEAVLSVTDLSNKAGASLEQIVGHIVANLDQAQSIAAAAEQQSSTSDEINRAVEEVNRIAAETASGMAQSASAINELAVMAEELRGVVESLKR